MYMQIIIKKIYIVFFLLFFTHHSFANEIFVSLKKSKVNVRYGPSFNSDIKYVYKMNIYKHESNYIQTWMQL